MYRVPTPGTETTIHPDGKQFHVKHRQDVEPVLEQNKRAQTANDGYTADRSMRRVGSVPKVVLYEAAKKMGISMKVALRSPELMNDLLWRLFNDPDYAHLRSAPKTVNKYVGGKAVYGPNGDIVSRV